MEIYFSALVSVCEVVAVFIIIWQLFDVLDVLCVWLQSSTAKNTALASFYSETVNLIREAVNILDKPDRHERK